MTPQEYTTWATHHAALFPDFRNWWTSLPGTSHVALREQFRGILSTTTVADAIEASNRMLAGTVDLCPAYERSMLASRIAAAAREIAAERAPRRPETHRPFRRSLPGEGLSAGEIYEQVLARSDKGEDPVEVARELIPPTANEDQPRYKCLKCQDTGLVWVWSNISVKAALAGTLDVRTNRRTMTVACECRLADQYVLADNATAPRGWRGWRESARYTPDRYCRCAGADVHNPERLAELQEWVQDYQRHSVANRPNYSPELAEWSK